MTDKLEKKAKKRKILTHVELIMLKTGTKLLELCIMTKGRKTKDEYFY